MSEPRPFSARQERFMQPLMKLMTAANNWIYRRTDGRLGGRWLQGAPILLLTVRGRRSGQPRTTPVLYLEDGGDLVVVASKAGFSKHPLWFLNLEANPEAEVQVGAEHRKVKARRASAAEKRTLWPRLLEMYSDFGDYQERTAREIPVVILEPR